MNETDSPSEMTKQNPETWVDRYGDYLYRYALSRLHEPEPAEDVVQETFLAALKARESFKGRSSERTWLTAILKHKIIDHYRKKSHEQPFDDIGLFQEMMDELFAADGRWRSGPAKWDVHPEELAERKEFWTYFYKCLSGLSDRIAHAFTLRELEGLSTKEICKVLKISTSNFWVMLYRARTHLRLCLEKNWFSTGAAGDK